MSRSPEEIEYIFRNSNSPEELFDAFRRAITGRNEDIELYKILLANPILSGEELKMYTEHLSKVFKDKAFDFFMWTGSIFANFSAEYERLEDSISYFVKAFYNNPHSAEPSCRLLQLYNFEFNAPTNKIIIDVVEECLSQVDKKSEVCMELSKLYNRMGNSSKGAEYRHLANKYSKEGH